MHLLGVVVRIGAYGMGISKAHYVAHVTENRMEALNGRP